MKKLTHVVCLSGLTLATGCHDVVALFEGRIEDQHVLRGDSRGGRINIASRSYTSTTPDLEPLGTFLNDRIGGDLVVDSSAGDVVITPVINGIVVRANTTSTRSGTVESSEGTGPESLPSIHLIPLANEYVGLREVVNPLLPAPGLPDVQPPTIPFALVGQIYSGLGLSLAAGREDRPSEIQASWAPGDPANAGEVLGIPTLVLRVSPYIHDVLQGAIQPWAVVDVKRLDYEIRIQPQICDADGPGVTCHQVLFGARGGVYDDYAFPGDDGAAPDTNLDIAINASLVRSDVDISLLPTCTIPLGLQICGALAILLETEVRPRLRPAFANFAFLVGGRDGAGRVQPGLVQGIQNGLPSLLNPSATDPLLADLATLATTVRAGSGFPAFATTIGTAPGLWNVTTEVAIERGATLPPLRPSPNLDNLLGTAPLVANTLRRLFFRPIEQELVPVGSLRPGMPVRETVARFTSITEATDGAGQPAAHFEWTLDRDLDGLDDSIDVCNFTADRLDTGTGLPIETDGDRFPDACDLCQGVRTNDGSDRDRDGIGTPCDCNADGDACADRPFDSVTARGSDCMGVNGLFDRFPGVARGLDRDLDGQDDDCDPFVDPDGDGLSDEIDNCPDTANPDQTNSGGIADLGDACDPLCSSPACPNINEMDDPTVLPRRANAFACLAGATPCDWLFTVFSCVGRPCSSCVPGAFLFGRGGTGAFVQGKSLDLPISADSLSAATARLPDRDGDGIEELVVSAPRVSVCAFGEQCSSGQGTTRAGSVFVVGSLSGRVLYRLDGHVRGERFGRAVSVVGDQLIVGAPGARTARENGDRRVGAFYVYDTSWPTPRLTATVFGAERGDKFGSSISLAGDANADGVPDIFVGASGARTHAGARAGRVELRTLEGAVLSHFDGTMRDARLGSRAVVVVTPTMIAIPSVHAGRGGMVFFFDTQGTPRSRIVGDPGDSLGTSMLGPIDIDGDGQLELAVGAPGARNGGAVRFYSLGGQLRGSWQSSSRVAPFQRLGERLLLVGDSDGDNHIEISVGHRDGSLIGEAHNPLTLFCPSHGYR